MEVSKTHDLALPLHDEPIQKFLIGPFGCDILLNCLQTDARSSKKPGSESGKAEQTFPAMKKTCDLNWAGRR
jgi:hypothetical protein